MLKSYPPKGTNSTPFNPQLQHFDMICGQVMKENGILKLALVVLIFIIAVLSIGISFFLTKRTQVIPAIVTINDFGQAQYVGDLSRKSFQNFNIPEVQLINFTKTVRLLLWNFKKFCKKLLIGL